MITIKDFQFQPFCSDLSEQAQASINKVKEEIKQSEIKQRNKQREAKVIEHFEIGNQVYAAGKLKEAEKEWRKAIEISQDPEMRDYIKESERKAKEEELARKKAEAERQKQIAAEKKENVWKQNVKSRKQLPNVKLREKVIVQFLEAIVSLRGPRT